MAKKKMDVRERISTLMHELGRHGDRGAGLLAAAALEDALAATIQERLMELSGCSREGLFGRTAPFSSFTAKIELGFALGLYGKEGRRTIEMIRDVFGVFVGEMAIQGFDDSVIMGLINKATGPHLPKNIPARQCFTMLVLETVYLLYVEQAADIRLASLCETHPRLFAQASSAAVQHVAGLAKPFGRSVPGLATPQCRP